MGFAFLGILAAKLFGGAGVRRGETGDTDSKGFSTRSCSRAPWVGSPLPQPTLVLDVREPLRRAWQRWGAPATRNRCELRMYVAELFCGYPLSRMCTVDLYGSVDGYVPHAHFVRRGKGLWARRKSGC